jgi:branched-chain amino acid transport system permease protein
MTATRERRDTLGTRVATGRAARTVTVVALVGVLALLPFLLSSFNLGIATRILIFAMFGIAFNIVFGLGGMPSLGHAAFFGTGGYVIALGTTRWEWDTLTLVVAVIALSAALGFIFGALSTRAEGVYHLLMTLALAQAIWGLAFQQIDITRGDHGITGLTRDTIPFVGADRVSFYYFVLLCVLASVALLRLFVSSPVGRATVGCREAASRMAALGFRVAWYRIGAYVVSAMFSGIAGALFAYHQRIVSPDNLAWTMSAVIFIMAILGGANSFYGPAIGATLLIILENWVSIHTARWMTVLALVFMIVILFLPQGLVGLARRRRARPHAAAEASTPNEGGPAPGAARSEARASSRSEDAE